MVDLLWAIRRNAPVGEMDRTQLHVLALVTRQPGLRSSEVSRIFGLDLSTVSRHVSELVARGWVERSEDPDDRRASRLQATAAGIALVEEISARQQQVLDTALASWGREDQLLLIDLIRRLTADLQEQNDVSSVAS